jgi:hypothetical protein
MRANRVYRTKRVTGLRIALACITGMTTVGSSSAPAQTRACPDGKWSAPIELRTPENHPVYIEPAPIAQHGSRFIVVNSPSWIWRSPTEFMSITMDTVGLREGKVASPWNLSRGGFLFDRAGVATPLDQPPRGKWLAHPILFPEDSTSVSVVWAQDTSWIHNFATHRIWTARIRNGKWETPKQLSSNPSKLRWFAQGTTQGRNDIPAYVATTDDSSGTFLLAGVLKDGQWYEGKLPMRYLEPAIRVAGVSDGVVAIVVGHISGRLGTTMLRLRISGDSLVADSQLLLDPQTRQSGAEGMIVRFRDDSLIAVWTLEDPSRGVNMLRTEVSRDGGSSWTRRAPLDLGERAEDLNLIVMPGGDAHLIYRSQPTRVLGGTGSLRHLINRGDTWHRVQSIGDLVNSSRLGAGAGNDGLVIYWTRSTRQYGLEVPQTVALWWSPVC